MLGLSQINKRWDLPLVGQDYSFIWPSGPCANLTWLGEGSLTPNDQLTIWHNGDKMIRLEDDTFGATRSDLFVCIGEQQAGPAVFAVRKCT